MVIKGLDKRETKRKPYVSYDPLVGYGYIPNTEMELTAPGGRKYTVKINSRGIRGNREYSAKKPPGIFRMLVFGDSMTAGQYVNNEDRFTERLEGMLPGMEFINFGLEGTGTDQQFLIFKQYARLFEYDAVLLCPFVENIRRNMVRYRLTVDLESGRWILTPKPRLEKKPDGTWSWTGIPVSKYRPFYDEAPPDVLKDTDFGGSDVNYKLQSILKTVLNSILEKTNAKGLLYSIVRHEPYHEYKNPYSYGWQTMKAILAEFTKLAGEKKFIVTPVVPYSFLRYNLANTYRARFSESSAYFLDILPHLKALSTEDKKRCFVSDDCHFSRFGHERIAIALAEEFRRVNLFGSEPVSCEGKRVKA